MHPWQLDIQASREKEIRNAFNRDNLHFRCQTIAPLSQNTAPEIQVSDKKKVKSLDKVEAMKALDLNSGAAN